jgi:hypothetical protein
LKYASEAALPSVIGRDAHRERTDCQAPAAHRRIPLEEKATAKQKPSSLPPKADCKPSKSSNGRFGVEGLREK